MKPKKHLSPHPAETASPASARKLLPGEATAAKFQLISKEELEATRCKAYTYVM